MNLKNVILGILILSILGVSAIFWAISPMEAMPEALNSLKTDNSVVVSTNQWLTFEPASSTPTIGFIFYPGAKVDPRAYAPSMRAIAAKGFLTIIVPMPFNLAIFGINEANDVIAAHPEIKTWVIGGHSLGGAMAASYAKNHENVIKGIVFWAAYPGESDSLAGTKLRALSIYASRDGLATLQNIENAKKFLPKDTKFVEIKGGNHAQFGWYGNQPGDLEATITRIQQQKIVVDETVEFLEGFEK